jgi:hypothetical protein
MVRQYIARLSQWMERKGVLVLPASAEPRGGGGEWHLVLAMPASRIALYLTLCASAILSA